MTMSETEKMAMVDILCTYRPTNKRQASSQSVLPYPKIHRRSQILYYYRGVSMIPDRLTNRNLNHHAISTQIPRAL